MFLHVSDNALKLPITKEMCAFVDNASALSTSASSQKRNNSENDRAQTLVGLTKQKEKN